MSRYIDADAIDYKHHKQHKNGKFNTDLLGDAKTLEDAFYKGVMYIHNCIEETPTADVVEVVHCKDCKHAEIQDYAPPSCRYCCKYSALYHAKNFYCSMGERREDDKGRNTTRI